MPIYDAPLSDMRFVFHDVFEATANLSALAGFEEVDRDLTDAILEEGAKICRDLLLPLNRSGDEEGCRLENGRVRTPSGFKEAYAQFVEGGWSSLAVDPAYGGQGLPESLNVLIEEMVNSANISFGLYPGLTRGAIIALSAHGDRRLNETYLPKMASGAWSGTMCLTEAHAGTDLGLLKCRAVARESGDYEITGTKIFITGGDHDLTENIVHLVLARLPDAPPGVKGLSMFLAPKFLPDEDGNIGAANKLSCGALEKKMGIKASATCVMNFDGATGYLVGAPNTGLSCMFTMMNAERLAIAMQGLGIGEIAYQNAVKYARERLQGQAANESLRTHKAADPLLVHPDIRRMLLSTRAVNEGCRALAVWTALRIDLSRHHPDPGQRRLADDLVSLVTPVIKAFFTDRGFQGATLCQQVFGGHGYIREWGMEQFVRDARIAQIYEGTNGVQALDLVRRKLTLHQGRLPASLFELFDACIADNRSHEALGPYLEPFSQACDGLKEATAWLVDEGAKNGDELGAAAVEYLRLFGLCLLAYMWVLMAKVALDKMAGEENDFYRTKLKTARFFMRRLLPQSEGLIKVIRAGAGPMMDFNDEEF